MELSRTRARLIRLGTPSARVSSIQILLDANNNERNQHVSRARTHIAADLAARKIASREEFRKLCEDIVP